jgi:AbrB family looped-hinge helix DNA binding protein
MKTTTVSTKGWIVVPKEMRVKYNLLPGSKVQIVDYGGGLAIVPLPEDPIAALRGIFADSPSLTDDLLRDRKRAREKEDARIGK